MTPGQVLALLDVHSENRSTSSGSGTSRGTRDDLAALAAMGPGD